MITQGSIPLHAKLGTMTAKPTAGGGSGGPARVVGTIFSHLGNGLFGVPKKQPRAPVGVIAKY